MFMTIPIIFAYSCYTTPIASSSCLLYFRHSFMSPSVLFFPFTIFFHTHTASRFSPLQLLLATLRVLDPSSSLEERRRRRSSMGRKKRGCRLHYKEKSKLCRHTRTAFLYGKQSAPNMYENCFASWLQRAPSFPLITIFKLL